uniref:Uncharacterized protein n=1 Tax=Zea mays TaxID=4577 RepID=C4J1H7_MAIZE|nr:unknown [Zea mays]
MRSAASSTVAIVCALDSSTLISKCSSRLITISTVSSESAPSSENFDSPQTSVWSGRASCFFTISQTLSVVSFLACHNPYFEMSLCLQYKRIYIEKGGTVYGYLARSRALQQH